MTYSNDCKKYRNFLIDRNNKKWAVYNLYMYEIKSDFTSVKDAKKYIDSLLSGDYQIVENLRNKRN